MNATLVHIGEWTIWHREARSGRRPAVATLS